MPGDENLRERRRLKTSPSEEEQEPLTAHAQESQEQSVTTDDRERLGVKASLRSTWQLARPFLLENPERRYAWVTAALGFGFLFLESFIMVKFSFIKRDYNSALQKKDEESFWKGVQSYALIIVGYIVVAGAQGFAAANFSLAWRKYLLEHFLKRYLDGRTFYALQLGSPQQAVDNPDQRICEDTSAFVDQSVKLFTVAVDSVMTVVSMSAVLLSISTDLCLFLLVYAIGGTIVTIYVFGKRMMSLAREAISQTATLRFYLIRVREHAESVAFYGGQARELAQASQRVSELFQTQLAQTYWSTGLGCFNKVYKYTTFVLPVVFVAPKYFRDEVEFGVVAQTTQAFIQILFALSVIVSKFENISGLGARVQRLEHLAAALEAAAEAPEECIELREAELPTALSLSSLTLFTPNGKTCICKGLNLELAVGSCCLIMGESGIGKSSLLRALAGLWTRGSGIIRVGQAAEDLEGNRKRPFFISQQCYMTLGSLRDQVLFPMDAAAAQKQGITDADIMTALELAHVPLHRKWGLHAQEDWAGLLSMGEQQRLAFARVFLHRPAFAFLDESTSAMDLRNEKHIYEELRRCGVSYVSVGHRQSLRDFHSVVLYGSMGSDGPCWQLEEASKDGA
eukprot:TRINITY_DN23601_c0_g1_i1.p1 TRINITY_DN23601_c0_g1~~TRINITY_DN23601_c0_g1_i1.p1  ORF type:complete len:636 (+),score=147.44 TRINITY_DN23601_c0_g1_i1:31-1908(+)